MDLRALHRHMKLADQIERVIAGQARQVEVLRENQRDQHRDRQSPRSCVGNASARFRCTFASRLLRRARALLAQPPNFASRTIADQRRQRKPRDACCPCGSTMNAASSGPERQSRISADLKQRLRQPVLPARRHPRHSRRFRMKHRRSHPHQRRRQQHRSGNFGAIDSSSSPTSVNPIPDASEYGIGAGPCTARSAAAAATPSSDTSA